PSVAFHDLSFRNRFGCVVSAFGVNVRLQLREKRGRGIFLEENGGVDTGERRDDLDPLGLWHDPAGAPLRPPDGVGEIDPDSEPVSLPAGRLEIANVARVKQVEGAVGENDLLSFLALLSGADKKLLESEDLFSRHEKPHHARRERSCAIASRSSSGVTVAVPIFMTTTPPAK